MEFDNVFAHEYFTDNIEKNSKVIGLSCSYIGFNKSFISRWEMNCSGVKRRWAVWFIHIVVHAVCNPRFINHNVNCSLPLLFSERLSDFNYKLHSFYVHVVFLIIQSRVQSRRLWYQVFLWCNVDVWIRGSWCVRLEFRLCIPTTDQHINLISIGCFGHLWNH